MRLLVHSLPLWGRIRRQLTNTGRRGLASRDTMRLVQFCHLNKEREVRVGVDLGQGQGIVDLKSFNSSVPSTMREFLETGHRGMECAQRYTNYPQTGLQ